MLTLTLSSFPSFSRDRRHLEHSEVFSFTPQYRIHSFAHVWIFIYSIPQFDKFFFASYTLTGKAWSWERMEPTIQSRSLKKLSVIPNIALKLCNFNIKSNRGCWASSTNLLARASLYRNHQPPPPGPVMICCFTNFSSSSFRCSFKWSCIRVIFIGCSVLPINDLTVWAPCKSNQYTPN